MALSTLRWMSQETALPWRRWKKGSQCRHQSVVAIGHDKIDLRPSARSQVFEHTHPTVFALLCPISQCQHLFIASQISHRAVRILVESAWSP